MFHKIIVKQVLKMCFTVRIISNISNILKINFFMYQKDKKTLPRITISSIKILVTLHKTTIKGTLNFMG